MRTDPAPLGILITVISCIETAIFCDVLLLVFSSLSQLPSAILKLIWSTAPTYERDVVPGLGVRNKWNPGPRPDFFAENKSICQMLIEENCELSN